MESKKGDQMRFVFLQCRNSALLWMKSIEIRILDIRVILLAWIIAEILVYERIRHESPTTK